MFIGSVLSIFRCYLVLYSAGSGMNGVRVVLSGLRMMLLYIVHVHLLLQSPAALQVAAHRQRLGEGNSEIKSHSPSYGSNNLTVL